MKTITKTKSKEDEVDWELVEQIRIGLEELKEGKAIPIEKSSLFK